MAKTRVILVAFEVGENVTDDQLAEALAKTTQEGEEFDPDIDVLDTCIMLSSGVREEREEGFTSL